MNPDIETFLQDAFKNLRSGVQGVGRVVVEPDYESAAPLQDPDQFAGELTKLLSHQNLDIIALASHAGFEVDNLHKYPLLQTLVRRITLHSDAAEGPWVEVSPPGNWI